MKQLERLRDAGTKLRTPTYTKWECQKKEEQRKYYLKTS